MATYEAIFFWMTLVVYALSSGGYIYSFVFKNERIIAKLMIFISAGLALHSAAIAARFVAQGHLPWTGDYENGLMGSWFIVVFTLYVGWKQKPLQALGTATLPCALLIMGYGVMKNPKLIPMAASLKTVWLYIHVYFAWLAFGAYTLAMATGVIYLLKKKSGGKAESQSFYERMPSLERLDELMFRYVIFGFITDAVMIMAGAIWAKDLWGNYWSWDPVETWSLVSWLIYAVSIHLRLTMGWRGSRQAWLVILAMISVLIVFFGVNLVVNSSLHMFNVRQI